MPRKRKEPSDNYNKAFPVAMRKLMDERGTTQNELADCLEKTRQSVSYYCDGSSSPDWETIVKIADYYNVSTDYLLGRTKDPSRQTCAADELGLSFEAVGNIIEWGAMNPSEEILNGLNLMLENKSFFRVAMELGFLHNWAISEEKRISKRMKDEYDPCGKDEGIPPEAFSEICDMDLKDNLLDELISNHPELDGHVDLCIGRESADYQIYKIMTLFDSIIRIASGYNNLIPD